MAIFYPNGKRYMDTSRKQASKVVSPSSISYGNRGMSLEEDINTTNSYYLEQDIAVIHKKPTPVQIVHVDYPKRSAAKITEAYFKRASTTDYNGVFKGRHLDFEAKETRNATLFPLKNVHEHQIEHMQQVKKHGGIAFILIKFTSTKDVYLLDADILNAYWLEQSCGSRKSIPRSVIETEGYFIQQGYLPRLDYLKKVEAIYFS